MGLKFPFPEKSDNEEIEPLMDIKEVSFYLGVSVRCMYEYVKNDPDMFGAKKYGARKPGGGVWRFKRSVIRELCGSQDDPDNYTFPSSA